MKNPTARPCTGLILTTFLLAEIQAQSVTWDADAGDGLWNTSTNWSGDAVPGGGDNIAITNGDAVTGVEFNSNYTLTLSGNSSLTDPVTNFAGGVWRAGGAAITVHSGSTLGSGGFWDLQNATLHFKNGAAVNMSAWEQKDTNVFTFELGPNGFTPLTPGSFRIGNGGLSADIANATYKVDMAAYTGPAGTTVTLVDFGTDNASMDDATFQGAAGLEVLNPNTYTANIQWNDSAESIELVIGGSAPPVSWDGGGSDISWLTPENWNPDGVPGATADVLVVSGATVTEAPNSFGTLEIETGATVTFPGQFLDGSKTLEVAGTLDGSGVLRFGATMDLSGSLGSGITFLDTNNSTINFVDGATFANPNLSFEHKGTNTFGYKLSSTGFSTLSVGQLFSGAGATWSDVTYNIDLSDYDQSNGLSIVLADYSGHSPVYNDPFNPTVNIIAGDSGLGGMLSFDTLSSQLILAIDPPGNDAPVASDLSYSTDGTALDITLSATDIEGDPLNYTVVSGPSQGNLDGTPPNLVYTYTGSDFTPDSFTYKANDGSVDSNIATVSIIPVQQTVSDLWSSLQSSIENDALNASTHTTWTEPHSDGSGDTITISRVTYELGTLVGTQHTATPVIAAYYARPTGATNLPGLLQNHGGGQRALSYIAKFWAEQGYAAICINWGGLNLTASNPNEPAPAPGQSHPNTNWDGLAGGFTRISTPTEPIENPVTEAIFKSDVDPAVYSDGQTLYDIPHPLNSSWTLNGYAGRRAITFLQDQPEVDDNKIGVLGWSMGGRTTMMTSTDPRITVLGPAVGGTGFLFEDFWGLPGTARSSNGWQDPELFRNTVDDQSYWPVVSAPVLFLNGSNDFNAPFDLATKSLSIHETGLNDVSPKNILATSPHYNHRVTDSVLASRIHWMRHHLKGDIGFPEVSDAELELTTPDGIPVFKVYPDTSTTYPVVSVDIVYGTDRDSRTRFWSDAPASDMGTHWEAKLPVFDANEMMAAHAIITYDIGFTQLMPAGSSPTNLFSVASKVHTYYPTGVDTTGYTFPADLDTDIHQFHLRSSEQLVADGLRETAEISHAIDDPSGPRGYKDWFVINPSNSVLWQFFTRKINDPCFRGGDGAQLTFDLTADAVNTLMVKIVVDQWSENSTTTYLASVPIAVGENQVSLSASDFKRADNTPLDAWSRAKFIGFGSGQAFNLNSDGWAGSLPVFADLEWDGGVTILDGGVPSTWLESFGLPLSNESTRDDSDGDGSNNGDEFKAGTDPTNSLSLLKISSAELQGNNLVIEWPVVAGKTYSLWSSSTLAQDSWILEESGISSPGVMAVRSLPIDQTRNFFRVEVE